MNIHIFVCAYMHIYMNLYVYTFDYLHVCKESGIDALVTPSAGL
jgi:hypothetical protein